MTIPIASKPFNSDLSLLSRGECKWAMIWRPQVWSMLAFVASIGIVNKSQRKQVRVRR